MSVARWLQVPLNLQETFKIDHTYSMSLHTYMHSGSYIHTGLLFIDMNDNMYKNVVRYLARIIGAHYALAPYSNNGLFFTF